MLCALSLAEVGLVTYLWLVTMVTCLQNVCQVQQANLMAAEKEFLAELALKYQALIVNKNSDEVTAYLSCVQNTNNNELSSSVVVEFYLTGHWWPVKFLSTWRSVNCWRNTINQMLVKSAG